MRAVTVVLAPKSLFCTVLRAAPRVARSVQYVAPSAPSACSARSAEDVRAAQRAQPAQSAQRMCELRAQRAQRGGCASRAAQRAQRAARRMCEPRSGSPVKERSRLRECDAHPEGIITMRLASRPIDVCIIIILLIIIQNERMSEGGGPTKMFEFFLFLSPGPSIPLAMSTHKILSPTSSPIFR